MTDLFGHSPDEGRRGDQFSLFGESDNRIPHPQAQPVVVDPEKVRRRLLALLETARSADRMPWTEKSARVWQIVFPNMANWLPEDEANQLRFAFAAEMERLKLAA